MIPKKYSGEELRNRYCRPVRKIKNGAGDAVSPDTICRIVNVVRGHGFTIETEKCSQCGQSAYISRIAREDLELIENPITDALVHDESKSAEKIQKLCDKIDRILAENDGCSCCQGDEALLWIDEHNSVFIDSQGEIMVTVKDNVLRFKADFCPKCGKNLKR